MSDGHCETRDGVDETEIEQIQRLSVHSPQMTWQENQIQSPEIFGNLDFNASQYQMTWQENQIHIPSPEIFGYLDFNASQRQMTWQENQIHIPSPQIFGNPDFNSSSQMSWQENQENHIQFPSLEIFGNPDFNASQPPTLCIVEVKGRLHRCDSAYKARLRCCDWAYKVKKTLNSMEGVKSVDINRKKKTVTVTGDPIKLQYFTAIIMRLRRRTYYELELISLSVPTQRTHIVQQRITPPFQRLQELPAEHDLYQADIYNQMSRSSISCPDVLPQETSLIEDNRLSPASPNLCIGNGPAIDLSSSYMHRESLEAGGRVFQMTESTQSAATPSALTITESCSDQGGMLTENVGSSNLLQFLTESTAQHDLQSKTMRGSILHVNISNEELLFEQRTPASARNLIGSSGDFIPKQIQELPSSAAGSTHGRLMPSENVGISLNNLTISAAEAFPDHSSDFTTSETFECRAAVQRWCCKVGSNNGFKVVVGRSDSGNGTKIENSTLVCERSGHCRRKGKNTELHQDKKLRTTATKKCECPFKLKCLMTNGSWTVQVIFGKHNHLCSPGFENPELQGKKIPSSCNIPSIGGEDEAGCQMFDSSLTTNKGDARGENRFQRNFGEGSSWLRTVIASNVGSRETPTCQRARGGRLKFSEPLPQTTSTEIVRVKATYGEATVKFDLSSTSGIGELKKQVAKKLELELGSFWVNYMDEDQEWVVISCDADLQVCVKMSSSLSNNPIRLKVTDKPANSGKCRKSFRGLNRKRSSEV